jgi:response regulator NasT
VLIADDEALIRMGLRTMLSEAGYQVVGEAGDGRRALDLVRKLDPDLVFLDIKMPEPDGLAVAQQVLAEGPRPIVVLTAYGDRENVDRAKRIGVMAYLVKPIKEADLVPTIELALTHFRTMGALSGEIRGLEEALETRKLVERAKGRARSPQDRQPGSHAPAASSDGTSGGFPGSKSCGSALASRSATAK